MASIEASGDVYDSDSRIGFGEVIAVIIRFVVTFFHDVFSTIRPEWRTPAAYGTAALSMMMFLWIWFHPAINRRKPVKLE